MKSWTANPRNVSLRIYQKRPETLFTTQTLEYNERLINGLFHTKCLDIHINEKIIILNLALSE